MFLLFFFLFFFPDFAHFALFFVTLSSPPPLSPPDEGVFIRGKGGESHPTPIKSR
jgi:hypothetical protein